MLRKPAVIAATVLGSTALLGGCSAAVSPDGSGAKINVSAPDVTLPDVTLPDATLPAGGEGGDGGDVNINVENPPATSAVSGTDQADEAASSIGSTLLVVALAILGIILVAAIASAIIRWVRSGARHHTAHRDEADLGTISSRLATEASNLGELTDGDAITAQERTLLADIDEAIRRSRRIESEIPAEDQSREAVSAVGAALTNLSAQVRQFASTATSGDGDKVATAKAELGAAADTLGRRSADLSGRHR